MDSDDQPGHSVGAIYGRHSTPKQASTPQQVELCRRHCELHDIVVRYILREEGEKAQNRERPQLQRLLALVEARRITVIVVWKLDRLVRSLQDLLNLKEFLDEHGVRLVSLTEQFDTTNSFGRFSFRNIASAAELERDLISERVQLGKFAMALAGKWTQNTPPYGYDLDADHFLVVNKQEAAIVRMVFRWYADGKPMTEICRQLGQRGVQTKRGNRVSVQLISKMLRNPTYIGQLTLMEQFHDSPQLRIIDAALWERVVARRGTRLDDGLSDERRASAIDHVVNGYRRYLEDLEKEGEIEGEENYDLSGSSDWSP